MDAMSQRQAELLRLQDALERLLSYQGQLEWTRDPAALSYLTDSMVRDLDWCRKACVQMSRQAQLLMVN